MPGALQEALAPAAQSTLKGALNAQGGPNNPKTPAYRENPEHDWYLALQAVRITAKEAIERVGEERGPIVRMILGSIRTGAEKLMAGVDPQTVASSIAADLVRDSRPDLAALLDQAKAPTGPPPGAGPPGPSMDVTGGGALADTAAAGAATAPPPTQPPASAAQPAA